jgi:hypothetical protein
MPKPQAPAPPVLKPQVPVKVSSMQECGYKYHKPKYCIHMAQRTWEKFPPQFTDVGPQWLVPKTLVPLMLVLWDLEKISYA